MKPLRSMMWACVLGTVALGAGPVQAGWNNVFQVTCFHCRKQPVAVSNYTPVVVSNYAPNPCCNPCPQVCTTQYVQRCYYQPVTSYETRSYYEPVTTYRTSYYYEPVTSYRYVSYYDPCSCSCQQVAVATTCYQMRSQCCPVQSWVQRCYQVAVTNYRQISYYEPVTTCSNPCPPPCAAPAPAATTAPPPAVTTSPPPSVSTSQPPYATQPGVTEQRGTAPGANGTSGSPLFDRRYDQRNYQPPTNPMPPASGALRPVPQQLPVRTPPAVRLDRITAVPNPTLEGQVVTHENRPRGGVQLVLVSAVKESHRRPVMTDAAGNFQVHLPPGEWLVYTPGVDGKPVLLSKVEVGDHETRKMTLVSK